MQSVCSSEAGINSQAESCSAVHSGELRHRILTSRFFAQAPEHPGFLATPTPTGPVIPIFTSKALLVRHAGAVRWFSTTGADLVALAPVGHRFVVDPGAPNEMVIDPNVFLSAVTSSEGSQLKAG